MTHAQHFYIDGQWVAPQSDATCEVIDPSTELPVARLAMASREDVDIAVTAARAAQPSFAASSPADRVALLETVAEVYRRRMGEAAHAVSQEMGAPLPLALEAHGPSGTEYLNAALEALKGFEFEEAHGTTTIRYEPVGVAALITPWNWPIDLVGKVATALAAGCTMVLKPSEVAPLSALVVADVLDEAGVPPGVFNLVNGDGLNAGRALTGHPGVDMVSFTGSTRAGIDVALSAAPSVKRVTQELGGKSANIILDDDGFEEAVARDIAEIFVNSGQSCNAGSRMLVPVDRMEEVSDMARRVVEQLTVGPPSSPGVNIGPVASRAQFDKVQRLIERGIIEGAHVAVGGAGRPEGLERGYFVKPTVFTKVDNDMTIAREEIFGPVLAVIGFNDEDDAVRIANDTPYGLSGYVSSSSHDRAQAIARRLRTGMVHLNGAPLNFEDPFGGVKQSGNGREFGTFGLRSFLEVKTIYGDRT